MKTLYFGLLILLSVALSACSTPKRLGWGKKIFLPNSQAIYSKRGEKVLLGGLSGLYFSQLESSVEFFVFYTITDRGPNGKTKDYTGDGFKDRPFSVPNFSPVILKLRYDVVSEKVFLEKKIQLQQERGQRVTGLPNVDRNKRNINFDETPVLYSGKKLKFDPWGLDPEGITMDRHGNFWICEEYGPSILKVSSSGVILGRWIPIVQGNKKIKLRSGKAKLPSNFGLRQLNRGFEGITFNAQGNLLVFLQSTFPGNENKKLVPVLEFDTNKEEPIRTLFYELDKNSKKIGGASLLKDGRIALIEQNGKTGSKAWQRVFAAQIMKSEHFAKEEIINLTDAGLSEFEKLEGITQLQDGRIVIINDNDFRGKTTSGNDKATSYGGNYLFFF